MTRSITPDFYTGELDVTYDYEESQVRVFEPGVSGLKPITRSFTEFTAFRHDNY